MKIRNLFIAIIVITIGCRKDENTSKPDIIGQWNFDYLLNLDGTKDYRNPYSMLSFGYNDGFVLNYDSTGNTVWYGEINDKFEKWRFENNELKIQIIRDSIKVDEFNFDILHLDNNRMIIKTPENNGSYFLLKN